VCVWKKDSRPSLGSLRAAVELHMGFSFSKVAGKKKKKTDHLEHNAAADINTLTLTHTYILPFQLCLIN